MTATGTACCGGTAAQRRGGVAGNHTRLVGVVGRATQSGVAQGWACLAGVCASCVKGGP